MKYRIEKNTVQETLILPLYSRKLCTELYPNLYRDETAVRLINQIDYDFSVAEKNSRSLMQRFGALEVAMRQNDLAFEVQEYLKTHPCAAVVNLGCGLDNTGRACDNGRCKIYNLDFPDVIALRQQLLPAGEREQNIPCDLKDPAWFGKIDASGGAVFFASGVFYYFLTQQVRELVQGMADAFPGGVLVFDAANRTAVKMIAKTWLKTAKIKDVGAYFAVSDAKSELSPWDSRLQVSSKGYMLGYNDLKDPSVGGFFRFLGQADVHLFYGFLEGDRHDRAAALGLKHKDYDDAGLIGIRADFSPTSYFTFGLSRLSMLGGDGNGLDSSDWGHWLYGRNDDADKDRWDDIAGGDFRLSLPGVTFYGELYGEDQSHYMLSKVAYRAGIYLPKLTHDGSWDMTLEMADTQRRLVRPPALQ